MSVSSNVFSFVLLSYFVATARTLLSGLPARCWRSSALVRRPTRGTWPCSSPATYLIAGRPLHDTSTYDAAISTCEKAGQQQLALRPFHDMLHS